MVRLTRVQQQQRTRARVLAAARQEFTEHGYTEAKVDRIAARAELTRGAVYSNFPGKRALYLAVLADQVERTTGSPPAVAPTSPATALGAFARVWLERLPLGGDLPADGQLRLRSLTGVLDDSPARTALPQLMKLEALLLGLAIEKLTTPDGAGQPRQVRLAELVLTLLHGAAADAQVAPGVADPFDLARACEHLAEVPLADAWDPPHVPYVPPAQPGRRSWPTPAGLHDQLTGEPVALGVDGVVVVLGSHRLAAAEEAVRAARPGEQVTIVAVTGDPAETGRLVRLRIGDLVGCLRRVFGAGAWSPLRLVFDDDGAVPRALGVAPGDDQTETAVRVGGGTIIAQADGRGAGHAAATAPHPHLSRGSGPGSPPGSA